MARTKNSSQGVPFNVTISEQSVEVLKRLARLGSYGRNAAEVGGRLLEQVITDRFTTQRRYDLEKLKRR
jgi:hypothetical protein